MSIIRPAKVLCAEKCYPYFRPRRKCASHLSSGFPVPSKPLTSERLTEDILRSPTSACPRDQPVSPPLSRSNSVGNLPSHSKIYSTVFNDEPTNVSSFSKKDPPRRSVSHTSTSKQAPSRTNSSRRIPVRVNCQRSSRDIPPHCQRSSRDIPPHCQSSSRDIPRNNEDSEMPATNKMALIKTSARDNMIVIQVPSQDVKRDDTGLSPENYSYPSSRVGYSPGEWTYSGSEESSSKGEEGTGWWTSQVASSNGVSTVSIRADLDEKLSLSANRMRKLTEEKTKTERKRHQQEILSLQQERALERKKFQLMVEQLQIEKERMKNEIMTLREKVKCLHMEQEDTEERLLQLAEQNNQAAAQEHQKQEEKAKEERMMRTLIEEKMGDLQHERDLEIKNFQMRLEQFQTEKEQMKNEMMNFREEVKFLHMEKGNLKEQLLQLTEQNKQIMVQDQDRQGGLSLKVEGLLIQLNQLSTRLSTQDSHLAEVRKDNSMLRNKNKKMKEEISNTNKDKENFCRTKDDPTDIRKKVSYLEEELADQREVNSQLQSYVGEVLVNIMAKNPQILEKN